MESSLIYCPLFLSLKNNNNDYFSSVGRKIVAVGRNYADHAAELGNSVPTKPLLFMKV